MLTCDLALALQGDTCPRPFFSSGVWSVTWSVGGIHPIHDGRWQGNGGRTRDRGTWREGTGRHAMHGPHSPPSSASFFHLTREIRRNNYADFLPQQNPHFTPAIAPAKLGLVTSYQAARLSSDKRQNQAAVSSGVQGEPGGLPAAPDCSVPSCGAWGHATASSLVL